MTHEPKVGELLPLWTREAVEWMTAFVTEHGFPPHALSVWQEAHGRGQATEREARKDEARDEMTVEADPKSEERVRQMNEPESLTVARARLVRALDVVPMDAAKAMMAIERALKEVDAALQAEQPEKASE